MIDRHVIDQKKKIEDDRDELSRDHRHDIAIRMRSNRYESAIRRWVDALNERGARARVEAAVHPEVRVARFGFGANTGRLMQDIRGVSGVVDWFGLSPKEVRFEIVDPVELESGVPSASSRPEGEVGEGGVARARYQVGSVGFSNGGTWRFGLSDDDLILWLEHRPDDLPESVHEERSVDGVDREHRQDDPHHLEHSHHN